MSKRRQRQLESTVAAIQRRYGPRALQRAGDLSRPSLPPHVATGFPQLDAITGCGGVPLEAITLLSGRTTSGKLTLAYKTLANAQHSDRGATQPQAVAIVDLAHNSDPDYLARCGIDLDHLLIVRTTGEGAIGDLLLDLVRSTHLRMVLVDNLAELTADRRSLRHFVGRLGAIRHQLRQTHCALLVSDDSNPPWRRWINALGMLDRRQPLYRQVDLHIELQHERWLRKNGQFSGYRAQVTVYRSRWRHDSPQAPIEIHFNGTVRAGVTW